MFGHAPQADFRMEPLEWPLSFRKLPLAWNGRSGQTQHHDKSVAERGMVIDEGV